MPATKPGNNEYQSPNIIVVYNFTKYTNTFSRTLDAYFQFDSLSNRDFIPGDSI